MWKRTKCGLQVESGLSMAMIGVDIRYEMHPGDHVNDETARPKPV